MKPCMSGKEAAAGSGGLAKPSARRLGNCNCQNRVSGVISWLLSGHQEIPIPTYGEIVGSATNPLFLGQMRPTNSVRLATC